MNRSLAKMVLLGTVLGTGALSRPAQGLTLIVNPPAACVVAPSTGAAVYVKPAWSFNAVATLLDALYKDYLGSDGLKAATDIVERWQSYANCARLDTAQLPAALLTAASKVVKGFASLEIRSSRANSDNVYVRNPVGKANPGTLEAVALPSILVGARVATICNMPIYELKYVERAPSDLDFKLSSLPSTPGIVYGGIRVLAIGCSKQLPGMRLLPAWVAGSPKVFVY